MLVIRKKQFEAFRQYMCEQFEARMVEHLKKYFPDQCANLSDDDVREVIRYGIERAKSYEILVEQDVSKYINLMFIFGRDYDKDPALPWAQKILRGPVLNGVKIDVLYEEAEKHLQS